MSHQLNHQALERLKALVRAGKYVDRPWRFSAEDSNAILGDPPNWTEYGNWFLGVDESAGKHVKARYGYPYGKSGKVYLSALRAIAARAAQQGDATIGDAASAALNEAQRQRQDHARADLGALDLRGAATIEAAVDENGQSKGPPTFSMLAYTGGPLQLKNWKHPVVVDLDGVSGHQKARPALRDHDPARPVGHMPAGGIKVSTGAAGAIRADGIISGHGPHTDEIVQSGLNGFPWQSSIGARVLKNEYVPPGRTAEANGRTFHGPINVARRTALGEISFVALGADDNTSARIAAEAAEGSIMTFEQWLEAMGLKLADLSAEQKPKLQAKFDAEQAQIAAAAAAAKEADCEDDDDEEDDQDDDQKDDDEEDDDEEDDDEEEDQPKKKARGKMKAKKASARKARAAGRKPQIAVAGAIELKAIRQQAAKEVRIVHAAESKRIGKIRQICAGRHADVEAKAIEEGWDESRTELAVLRAERPKSTGAPAGSFGINVGAGAQVTPEIVAAAAAMSGGVSEKAAMLGLSEQQANLAASRRVRQASSSIYGLCSMIAAAHGVRLPAPRMEDDVIRAMFSIDRKAQEMDIHAADGGTGGFSTMSLSGITENILNKAMLEAYGVVDTVVPDVAYETDTNDFKQFKRYRLTASGLLSALGAAGDLKSISLQDESYPNQVKTQGVILTVGRDILLNDDMGALTQAPTLLGRGSALYREMVVFGNLLSATATVAPGASVGQTANAFNFFSTGAKNYLSGGTSVLQISSLTTAVQKFREQTDANNLPIMLKPDRLLLPPALEVPGKNLFNGAELVVTALTSTSAAAKSTDPNINAHKGAYRPIISPFLSATVGAKLATAFKGDPTFANFSSASDTAWYLLTSPTGGFATIQIGYLRGQRAPIIERGEANFSTLGIAMRCYYDFGVALHDYRCGVLSAGA